MFSRPGTGVACHGLRPVLRDPGGPPLDAESEHLAYKDTLEQAILGDKVGFHAFWTVEHHFLEEYSHCSNPEVLYGASRRGPKNIRIGYGVRLLPKPYNHPIRTAESVAVLDLIPTAASSSAPGGRRRARARGLRRRPARDPPDVERGARPHRRGWTERTSTRPTASTGRWAPAACTRSRCRSRTRRSWARRRAPTATRRSGCRASGCARSPSACRPSSSPSASPCTARASPSARAGRQVRQRHRRDLHDGPLRTHERGGHRGRQGELRGTRARRPADRVGGRVDGGAKGGATSAPTLHGRDARAAPKA